MKAGRRFRGAEAALAAAEGAADAVFDRVNARFNRALLGLLRARAPNLAGLATKLDLLVEHQVWELTFAPSALASLRRDARRLSRPSRPPGAGERRRQDPRRDAEAPRG